MTTTRSGSRWFRTSLWLHRWTSLVATIPFLILCLTGTVLIFHEEIDHALGVVPVAQGDTTLPQRPLAEAVAKVQAAYPDERVLSIGVDPEEDRRRFLVTERGVTLVTPDMLGQQIHHLR